MHLCCLSIFQEEVASQRVYTVNDTTTLQRDMLANYDKKQRPQSQTNLLLEFGLLHITELDIVTQRLFSMGFLLIDWKDDRLQWTPSNYGNITASMFRLSDIWIPPLVLSNAADELKILGDNSDFASSPVYVASTGDVVWMAPASFVAQCTVNIKYYPFDSQSCKLVVSSWLFLEFMIDLGAMSQTINLDIYEEHGEWEVTGTSVTNRTRSISGYQLAAIDFTLELKRKYSYYLLNMLLPVIILATMAPFVFILPVESGEKISFALTILLSLSVVMTIVSDNIPPTSTHICVLSVYLLMTFILCSVQTLVTVLVCRVHELHNKTYIMGTTCKKTVRLLAKLTKYRRRPRGDALSEVKDVHGIKETQVVSQEKIDLPKSKGTAWAENETDKPEDDSIDEHIEYTYEDMVIMSEKFNFYLFTVLTLLTTIICMIILETNGGESVK
ncbi:neuronal acetylcholine receptor subunit alpha-2-like isoform X2 [Ruditapes philippinarum]|uniref:neuronal acetylcholine receptor subunit alpha-2-like isoform X2 n=1 Tax=Ruditapes philippinarum TaxID=129788 RepID=UPI00295BE778|nr:neuronal acetylcholine receptor subunit alpha-2-like isoform X2 [Ruditapes philippinarum]